MGQTPLLSHSGIGFLEAHQLDGQGGSSRLSPDDAAAAISSAAPLWLHFDVNAAETRPWLERHSKLPLTVVNALLAADTRPRIAKTQDNLMLILRGFGAGLAAGELVSLRIWSDGERVISTRMSPLGATDDLRERLEAGTGPNTSRELLLSWLNGVVGTMDEPLNALENEALDLEERVLSESYRDLQPSFSHHRRTALKFKRFLEPQRQALGQLARLELPWLGETDITILHEIAERQARYVDLLNHVHTHIVLAHEEVLSQLSAEMNERMYVMSIVAALFLPLGFFTGLLGINVGGIPGVNNEAAFWIVSGLCGAILLVLTAIFRKRGWW